MKITIYILEGLSTTNHYIGICRIHNFSFPRPPTPNTQTYTNIHKHTQTYIYPPTKTWMI
jgi:hypothetical protein